MIRRLKDWYRELQAPKENPVDFMAKGRTVGVTSVVACIGDSLTHGIASANYVAMLHQRLSTQGYEFINAGINGDLGYNVLQRLDDILQCRPQTAVVLVGTNDINATSGPKVAEYYHKHKQIPVVPDLAWSAGNIEQIFARLKAGGVANVAILSIPMLGENIDSEINRRVDCYNEKLRELASRHQVTYLPLHERLIEMLPKRPMPPVYKGEMGPILKAAFFRLILRQPWDVVSEKQGFYFLTDHIHLNDRGARVISDLVEGYLKDLSRV